LCTVGKTLFPEMLSPVGKKPLYWKCVFAKFPQFYEVIQVYYLSCPRAKHLSLFLYITENLDPPAC